MDRLDPIFRSWTASKFRRRCSCPSRGPCAQNWAGRAADPILRDMVGGWARGIGAMLAAQSGAADPLQKLADGLPFFAAGEAIDVENVTLDAESLRFDVTGCRYAAFFKEIDAADLGALLICDMDPPMAEGISPDLKLERSQTIMGGADHCDFCFKKRRTA